MRPLLNAIKKTELRMAEAEQKLEGIQGRLAQSELYEAERKIELADLLKLEGELKALGAELEDQWLEQQQTLEELND